MKITKAWLDEWSPREDGLTEAAKYIVHKNLVGADGIAVVQQLIEDTRLWDAIWVLVRILGAQNARRYAVHAAEQVISSYEDSRRDGLARQMIEAAKRYISEPTEQNRRHADSLGYRHVDCSGLSPNEEAALKAAKLAAMSVATDNEYGLEEYYVASAAEDAVDWASEVIGPEGLSGLLDYGMRLAGYSS
jgi:hypothetical protein